MSYLNTILKDKLTISTEIELHLFEYCNLKCSFCSQDHQSKVGMSTIVDKADKVIDFINSSALDKHTINLMGGELFNDEIDSNTFNDYYLFYTKINDYCNDTNQVVRFNWVTNLIFTKTRDLVDKLFNLMDNNAYISTSYDFMGRGYDINKQLLFKENIEYYKEKIGVIGFVLTKPSIKRMISGATTNKYFNYLYTNYPLYFDYYVPELNPNKNMPSELELYEAFTYIAKHYPKVEPIYSMLNRENNEMTCYSLNKTTILPDGENVTCRYLKYDTSDFRNDVNYSSNENIIMDYLTRYNCLSCKYYNRCQFRCFVQHDSTFQVREDYCIIKRFFNEQLGVVDE